jgi:hypothetical protein
MKSAREVKREYMGWPEKRQLLAVVASGLLSFSNFETV